MCKCKLRCIVFALKARRAQAERVDGWAVGGGDVNEGRGNHMQTHYPPFFSVAFDFRMAIVIYAWAGLVHALNRTAITRRASQYANVKCTAKSIDLLYIDIIVTGTPTTAITIHE